MSAEKCIFKNLVNSYYSVEYLGQQSIPLCFSSATGKLFCWPEIPQRSPGDQKTKPSFPLSVIPADRFHCYFQNNRLLFLLCDKEKQNDLTYNCTRSLKSSSGMQEEKCMVLVEPLTKYSCC